MKLGGGKGASQPDKSSPPSCNQFWDISALLSDGITSQQKHRRTSSCWVQCATYETIRGLSAYTYENARDFNYDFPVSFDGSGSAYKEKCGSRPVSVLHGNSDLNEQNYIFSSRVEADL